MKKTLIAITFLLCIVSTNIQAKDVFSGDWVLRLTSDGIKQKVTFKQKGTSVVGKLENGHLLSGTWNFKTKKLTGYISIKGIYADPYPFYAFFKGRSKTFVVGQYNRYATGKPKYPLNLKKIEKGIKNLKGEWSTTSGKMKIHWDKNNIIRGQHFLPSGHTGVLIGYRKGDTVEGKINYIGVSSTSINPTSFFKIKIGENRFNGRRGKTKNNLNTRWSGVLYKANGKWVHSYQ